MLSKLRQRTGNESGFTLIELLVVMLILAILAAIAVPSFFNQRDKARDSDAKSGVRSAQTAIETYATDNDGSFAGAAPADLTAIEEVLADYGGSLTVPRATDQEYTVRVVSDTGVSFEIRREADGATTTFCDTPDEGGCPSDQSW